jgi:hypothetical protein
VWRPRGGPRGTRVSCPLRLPPLPARPELYRSSRPLTFIASRGRPGHGPTRPSCSGPRHRCPTEAPHTSPPAGATQRSHERDLAELRAQLEAAAASSRPSTPARESALHGPRLRHRLRHERRLRRWRRRWAGQRVAPPRTWSDPGRRWAVMSMQPQQPDGAQPSLLVTALVLAHRETQADHRTAIAAEHQHDLGRARLAGGHRRPATRQRRRRAGRPAPSGGRSRGGPGRRAGQSPAHRPGRPRSWRERTSWTRRSPRTRCAATRTTAHTACSTAPRAEPAPPAPGPGTETRSLRRTVDSCSSRARTRRRASPLCSAAKPAPGARPARSTLSGR